VAAETPALDGLAGITAASLEHNSLQATAADWVRECPGRAGKISWLAPGGASTLASWPELVSLLDFCGGLCRAVFHCGLERGVVAFVLVGVGFGEVGDRLVELG